MLSVTTREAAKERQRGWKLLTSWGKNQKIECATAASPCEHHDMPDAIQICVRAALDLAIAEGRWVRLVLRRDAPGATDARVIDGAPYEVGPSADGRERVFVRIAESTEQVLLVERIERVLTI